MMSRAEDLPGIALSDSEATLRQVEAALAEFGGGADGRDIDEVMGGLEEHPAGLRKLVTLLIGTYTEIMEVIESLRQSRGLLEQAAMERLRSTHEKLAEVSSATEVAATGMLDCLDRALSLVDDLESRAKDGEPAEVADTLRDELHQVVNLLQFQDITAQQLGYASGVLLDIEERMVRLVKIFDFERMGLGGLREAPDDRDTASGAASSGAPEVCDPGASTLGADDRQALADEIFTTS